MGSVTGNQALPPSRRAGRRSWLDRPSVRVTWWFCVLATALNAWVVGYWSVEVQFFGDRADRGDYLVASGGYLAGGLVLALAALTGQAAGIGPVGRASTAGVSALLLVLAMSRREAAYARPPHGRPSAGMLDGVGGVVALPWAWFLVAVTLTAAYLRLRR